MTELKTLIVDMELAYALYYAFPSKKPQYLSSKQLKDPLFCPCAAWKWDHQAHVQTISTLDDKKRFRKNHRDDRLVAEKLHELFTEADIIVAHNGDAFDIKHANTLFAKHGLGPVPEKKSVDTLKAARKYFAFEGNDLGFLCRFFKVPSKLDKPDWIKITEGDAAETQKVVRYCKQDVLSLAGVFEKIKPFIHRLPSLRRYKDKIERCDSCASKRLNNKGSYFFNGLYYRVKCMECGKEHKCGQPFKKEPDRDG